MESNYVGYSNKQNIERAISLIKEATSNFDNFINIQKEIISDYTSSNLWEGKTKDAAVEKNNELYRNGKSIVESLNSFANSFSEELKAYDTFDEVVYKNADKLSDGKDLVI